jgi:polysaccharide biosynthesis/export protein
MQFIYLCRRMLVWILIIQTGFVLPTLVLAQSSGYQEGKILNTNQPRAQAVGEDGKYYLNEYNELLIRVNIWGQVRSPGQYFVPATTDLITLISIAGGPSNRSRLSDIAVVRQSDTGESEVIQVNVKKYLRTGDKRLIPDLKPEDTVLIHGSAWQLVADVVQVVSQLAVVGSVYYYFFRAGK